MNYFDIFNNFTPKIIKIDDDYTALRQCLKNTNLLVYGEIHGNIENAHVVYTLCHELDVEQLGVELPYAIKPFLDSTKSGKPDFSLIDADMFQASILSVEMAKTIATLMKEGLVKEIVYLDTYTNGRHEENKFSPQGREKQLADNILGINNALLTLCIMGNWHTRPEAVSQPKKIGDEYVPDLDNLHYSALYRVREVKPETPYIKVVYGGGEIYNAGNRIVLDSHPEILGYGLAYKNANNFEFTVPVAHRISIPTV